MRSFRLRSRSSHRRETAKARSGSAAALGSHRLHHLLDQPVLLEAHVPPRRRLHQRPPQRLRGGRRERREVVEDGPQAVLLAAAEQEVVAQRQQDVDLGLLREAAEERREASLHLRSVQGKELLELVHDEEGLVALLPPTADGGERPIGLPGQAQFLDPLEQLTDRVGISGEIGDEGPGERQGRAGPGRRVDDSPARRSARDHPRPEERRLPHSRWPDDGQQLLAPDLLPQSLDLGLTAEEEGRVGFREGGQPRIGAESLPGGVACAGAGLLDGLAGDRASVSVRACFPAERVAEAVDRPDEPRVPRVVLERLADGIHHHGQGRLGDEGLRPDHVADLGPGERPRPALQEQAQQLVGLRLERDRLTRAKELPTLLVELEVPKEERHGPRPGGRNKESAAPSESWAKDRQPSSRTQERSGASHRRSCAVQAHAYDLGAWVVRGPR